MKNQFISFRLRKISKIVPFCFIKMPVANRLNSLSEIVEYVGDKHILNIKYMLSVC